MIDFIFWVALFSAVLATINLVLFFKDKRSKQKANHFTIHAYNCTANKLCGEIKKLMRNGEL